MDNNKWRSTENATKDELPEMGEWVIFAVRYDEDNSEDNATDTWFGTFTGDKWYGCSIEAAFSYGPDKASLRRDIDIIEVISEMSGEVTHWMPLPDPPE